MNSDGEIGERDISGTCIGPNSGIRDAIACIDDTPWASIALIVDEDRRLLGTVTDGDVRRAMLLGWNLDVPVSRILKRKKGTRYETPVTAHVGTPQEELRDLMREHVILHIPLLSADGKVIGLVTHRDLGADSELPLTAVVMAGGMGTRLRPLTDSVPKPMLPVGDRPLLEHIIERLEKAGVRQVQVTTHYLPDKITEHFGDGSAFGVEIMYVNEVQPLGTAGSLRLLETPNDHPLLVMNGDVLTSVDVGKLLAFHHEQEAAATIAVRRYEVGVPYGVIEVDGGMVQSIDEKPERSFFVNAGIYLLEPSTLEHIPEGRRYDMTELIQRLLDLGEPVSTFALREYWIDIGQLADYEQVQEDVEEGEHLNTQIA